VSNTYQVRKSLIKNSSEHSKHHSEYHPRENVPTYDSGATSTAHTSAKDASFLTGPAPNTAGPHNKDWMNKLDPFVDANPSSKAPDPNTLALPIRSGQGSSPERTLDQQGRHLPRSDVGEASALRDQKSHHYGRDAAAAGALGGTRYELEKHHRESEVREPSTLANPSNTTATANSTGATTTTATGAKHSISDTNDPKDHNYGRDAALAGGVGGATHKIEHHKHDKDVTQEVKDAKKEHNHEVEAKKENRHEAKEERTDNKGGILGFLREYFQQPIHITLPLIIFQIETRTRSILQKKKPSSIAKNVSIIPLTKNVTPLQLEQPQ
jgi:hypothetical protein